MSSSQIHQQMAETKQLVLVVEGTDALRPYWPTIVSTYLEKVIRSFCGNDNQKVLAFVLFNAHGTRNSVFFFFLSNTSSLQFSSNLPSVLDAAFVIVRSSWTNNVETFMQWLNAINFSSTLSSGAAIAEGLGEALMMFPYENRVQNQGNHCILVAASNPHPHPTPVYTPPCYIPPHFKAMQPGTVLCDAETVAKSFPMSFVSLSVISPRRIPKLEAIYNAAKGLLPETGRTIRIVTNPDNLVLISEHFNEALAALSQTETTKVPPNTSPEVVDLTGDSSSDS
ncbi:hypothetical protein L2E82_43193 [Cichorium intybus]|uniref:Uncharacterized protein n=1 Tax=Cichorium intybus TaxID=13427 RepID=A0ACB8ZP84_CICIN|nr:hypothetical protein L2E82_43193 [Cichorium intybus]